MSLHIRKATESDLEKILTLYAPLESHPDDVLTLDEARRIFQKMRIYPSYHVFVAIQDDQIVGTFALLIMDNLAHRGAPSGVLEDVVVDARCQGRGIGKQMMQFSLDFCKAAGCYKLALSSNLKRTQAHQFYESLGFLQHGISFSCLL